MLQDETSEGDLKSDENKVRLNKIMHKSIKFAIESENLKKKYYLYG